MHLAQLKKELIKQNNNKQELNNSKLNMLKAKTNISNTEKKETTTELPAVQSTENNKGKEFKEFSLTKHFIQRAQERFGVKDYEDYNKNYSTTFAWVNNLVSNYDEVVEDTYGITFVRYKSVVLVYNKSENIFVTCYPVSYDTVNKVDDTLKVAIVKKKLELDSLTRTTVEETLKGLYYRELRSYSKSLEKYYGTISDIYKGIANNKHNTAVDARLNEIKDCKSVIHSIEMKIQSFYNIAYAGVAKKEVNNDQE